MTVFKQLYTATADISKRLKMPKIKGKIERAFDGARDAYECEKIDIEEKIDAHMAQLANGDTAQIERLLELELDIDAIDVAIGKILKLQGRMFSEVQEQKTEE